MNSTPYPMIVVTTLLLLALYVIVFDRWPIGLDRLVGRRTLPRAARGAR